MRQEKPTTFADLGMPFPLYEGPAADHCADLQSLGRCSACAASGLYCFRGGADFLVCYQCLRAGRGAFSMNTVFGLVDREQALLGLTHGVPGIESDEFELIPCEGDPEWMQARIPAEHLLELTRTPNYSTWQGELWQFCCRKPMIYVGAWKEADFERNAKDGDGRALFESARIDGVDASWWGVLGDIGGPYMFRCADCQGLRGHYDMD